MCGLAGILRTDGQAIPEAWLDALDAALVARGPDGHGRFRARVPTGGPGAQAGAPAGGEGRCEIAFVHRRLAILDRAGGAQPMTIDDGRGAVTVLFNGCIYNHRALRTDLEARGHRFRSDHADTETLLHGWREHGTDLPRQLEGMYAFAIWDAHAGTLFVARDPFGEKPLWLAHPTRGVFAFASMAAPLLQLWPEALRRADSGSVAEYLRRGYGWTVRSGGRPSNGSDRDEFVLAPLRPGSWLSVARNGVATSGTHHANLAPGELAEAPTVERIGRALDAAVARRLDADVPLGCFLSGGVDSALIAATAVRHAGRLRTFCVRMPDAALDESERAAAIAAHLGTVHTTLDVDARGAGAADDLCMLASSIGVPFGDSSILPTHWVSRAARDAVTVALSGDGGDELFLGYRRHVLADRIARLQRVLRLAPSRLPGPTLQRVRDIAADLPHTGVLAFAAPFPERLVRELVPDAPMPEPSPIRSGRHGALRALRAHDLHSYLPDDLLLKVDAGSMAVALEVRAPLLDRDLARMAVGAPIDALLSAPPCRGRKALLRAVARRHLPAALVDGPKRGFAIPIGRWWRDDFGGLGALLRDALGRADPFGHLPIETRIARRLMDDHLAGRADHGQRLFCLLTLALWAKSP